MQDVEILHAMLHLGRYYLPEPPIQAKCLDRHYVPAKHLWLAVENGKNAQEN